MPPLLATTTRRFDANLEQSVVLISGDANPNRGSGKDQHIPYGKGSFDGSWVFRGLERFAHDWSGMTQVVKVELNLRLTSGQHTALGSGRRVQIGRNSSAFTSGGGGENAWAYGISDTVYPGPAAAGSIDFPITAYGSGDWIKLDITSVYAPLIPASVLGPTGTPGAGNSNYGIRIWSYDEAFSSRSAEFFGLRSSYTPYLTITYTFNSPPNKPVATSPKGGAAIAPGSNPQFSWTGTDPDVGDTMAGYDLQVGSSSTFATTIYSGVALTAGTVSGFNVTNAPYPGGVLPVDGTPLYWRVRQKDQYGVYSAWSDGAQFVMSALPTVSSPTPNATLSDIANLDDLAIWTTGGAHAKPILSFVYGSATAKSMAAYRLRIYNSASVPQQDTTVNLTALPGATVVLRPIFPMVLGTLYKWGVEVRDTLGNWSTAMALRDLKVRWGQGILTQNVGVGASGLNVRTGSLTNGGMALLYRTADDAAMTTNVSGWVTDVGALNVVRAYVQVMVRLVAKVSGQNPTLPDITLGYTAVAAALPDKWQASAGATLVLDNRRRFGAFAAKLTGAVAGTAYYMYCWRHVTTDGILVVADTDYIYSAYVNTGGALGGTGQVQLMVRNAWNGGAYTFDPAIQPAGVSYFTSDTSTSPDGWQRLVARFHVPKGTSQVWPTIWFRPGANNQAIWVDAGKWEEGAVVTTWAPGLIGSAGAVDAMGLVVDGSAGGVFRLRGTTGGARDTVELGSGGLTYGGEAEISSPAAGAMRITPAIDLPEGAIPATPPSGFWRLYGTATSVYAKGDTGTVLDLGVQGGTGTSGPPTGPAGGVLAGSYPNPGFAQDMATQAELDAHALLPPSGPAGGVLNGTYPNPGFAVDMATQAELDAVQATIATTPSPPSGSAGGVLAGSYPNPAFAADMATQVELDAHAAALDPHTGYQKESEKGTALGYASLDSSTRVPPDQMGAGVPDATTYLRGDRTWQTVAGGGGGGVTDADYLVGTANPGLSAEIVVGTSPGGELGGSWASPTVDASHSGSTHAATQAAAEATAAAGLAGHVAGTVQATHPAFQLLAQKAQPNGYASLDATTKVPVAQLGSGTVDGTRFLRDDRTWQPTAADPTAGAVNLLQNGGFRDGTNCWAYGGSATATLGMWPASATDWTLRDGDASAWVPGSTTARGSTAHLVFTGPEAAAKFGWAYQQVPVASHEYYSASALLGAQSLTGCYLELKWFDVTGAVLQTDQSTGANGSAPPMTLTNRGGPDYDDWALHTIAAVLSPLNAVYCEFRIVGQTPVTASGSNPGHLFMDQGWLGVGRTPKRYQVVPPVLPTAADLALIVPPQIGVLTAWTPVIGGSGSAPVMGTSTKLGNYVLLGDDLVWLEVYINLQGATYVGTTNLNISLPPGQVVGPGTGRQFSMQGVVISPGATPNYYPLMVECIPGQAGAWLRHAVSPMPQCTPTVPLAWNANGTILHVTGVYRTA
jgi:hypothetical protein